MNADDGSWDYKPDGKTKSAAPQLGRSSPGSAKAKLTNASEAVEWTASEYIEHSRGVSWYLMLLVTTAALTALAYWLTKEIFASVIVALTGIVIVIFTFHKPKETIYRLSSTGLVIGEKNYPYDSFKSFAIIREGGLNSLNLVPVKRFMPPITAYFEAKDESKILEVIGQHLPLEERGLDAVERLSRRLRF